MSISFSQEIPVEDNNKTKINIKETISELLKKKKKNRLLGKELINKLDLKIKKDSLILQLKKDYKYYEMLEKIKQLNLEDIILKREDIEENLNSARDYNSSLREEMHEFVKGLDLYEDKIKELQNERENIYSSTYSTLKKKTEEKLELEKRLSDVSKQINQQKELIKNMDIRYQSLKKQKDKEEDKLMKQEAIDIDKYNKLFKKYREMLTKYNLYEKEEDNNHNNDLAISRKIYEENLLNEELKMKLTEAKLKNESLQKNIDDISTKVSLIYKDEINSKFKTIESTINSTNIGNYS
jgi:hypothetical protein